MHTKTLYLNKLGMESMFVLSGVGKAEKNKFDKCYRPDFFANNLYTGAKKLTK